MYNNKYMGAIMGDIVGSRFEFHNRRSKEFTLFHRKSQFTDDSILTLAIMDSFNKGIVDEKDALIKNIQEWARSYPAGGYGQMFKRWIYLDDPQPYHSCGNGSAMRISPVAYFAKDKEELDRLIDQVTLITHDHPEGLKGARVVATATFMALHGATKEELREYIEANYDINFDYEDLVQNYYFDETCQKSVPQALFCFLISESLEDCVRTAVSIGGDSDTIAAIACSVGAAFYPDPNNLLGQAKELLEELGDVCDKFGQTCQNHLN